MPCGSEVSMQGLRIAPPEAPCTGYMFGKGIYFSEVSSKAANYCFASPMHPIGFLLVCEVALGNQMKLFLPKYIGDTPGVCKRAGLDSVKGVGQTGPSAKTAVYLPDGVRVCMGPLDTEDDCAERQRCALLYTEHIVYDVSRVRLKYILQLRFEFEPFKSAPSPIRSLEGLGTSGNGTRASFSEHVKDVISSSDEISDEVRASSLETSSIKISFCSKNHSDHHSENSDQDERQVGENSVLASASISVCDPNSQIDIFVAAKKGDAKMLHNLISSGADVNCRDSSGKCVAHVAVENGQLNFLKILVSLSGVDLNLYDSSGCSVIEYAVFRRAKQIKAKGKAESLEILKLLIQSGAAINSIDVTSYNDYQRPRICYAGRHANGLCSWHLCPLLVATSHTDYDCMKVLIDAGCDVKHCYSSIIDSVKQNNSRCLKLLLDSGFDVNTCPEALLMATEIAAVGCLKLMIAAGANFSQINQAGKSCLVVACEQGHVKSLKLILQTMSRECIADSISAGSLFAAAKNGFRKCLKLLIDAGFDVNQRDLLGRSAAHYAAESGYLNCLKQLIDAGCDVSQLDTTGRCALHLAAENASFACMKLCLEHTHEDLLASSVKLSCMEGQPITLRAYIHAGVDLTHLDLIRFVIAGFFQFQHQMKSKKRIFGVTQAAVGVNCHDDQGGEFFEGTTQYSQCILHLVSAGLNINTRDTSGSSCLLQAAELGFLDGIRILISSGVDVNICNHAGRSPLLAASERGFVNCVEILIAAGADINHCDSDGRSSVLLSSERGHSDCLIRLLSAGGNFHQMDLLGRSPLSVAVMRVAQCGVIQSLQEDRSISSLLFYGAQLESAIKYFNSVESSIIHTDQALHKNLTTLLKQASLLEFKPSFNLFPRDTNSILASIRGNLDACLRDRHQFRKKILRFFVSSTFDDTAEERRVLLSTVMPKVQMRAQKLGFDIILSEMRFGIRDNNDHRASEICISELHRCFEVSVGLCYFLICGDKYGFRPMPRIIPESELRCLLGHMNQAEQTLVLELYELDENAILNNGNPAPEFVLKHACTSMTATAYSAIANSDIFWHVKYPLLISALKKAAMLQWPASVVEINDSKSSHPIKRYFISITETEAYHGLFRLNEGEIKNKCFVVQRTLLGQNGLPIHQMIPSTPKLKDFADLFEGKIDGSAMDQLATFRKNVDDAAKALHSNQYIRYPPLIWVDGKGIDPANDDHQSYLKAFATDSINYLTTCLLQAHYRLNKEPNELMDECLHHIIYAHDKFSPFELTTVPSDAFRALQSYIHFTGSCSHIFVVHGEPGCGKTFLMSQAVTLAARESELSGHVVIARFLGTSTSSSSVTNLLRSVCNQMHAIIGSDPPPLEFEALKSYFASVLSNWQHGRLLMFIDSLDQLDDSNGGRQLQWLPVSGLSSKVRLVVSTADDDAAPLDARAYKCLSILQSKLRQSMGRVPDAREMVHISPVINFSGLVFHIMRHKRRRLSHFQASELDKAISASPNLRTPLVACVLANFYMDVPSSASNLPGILFSVPPSRNLHIRDIIIDLFSKLEVRHGKVFVKAVLSYLTLAKDGLAESELAEVLSLNDDVLADIYQWWVTPVRTMPSSPLTLLFSDLIPFLSHRGCSIGGTELLFWYHKQFLEAVRFYYLRDFSFVKDVHSELADFFCGVWAGREKPYNPALCDAVNKRFPGETQGDRLNRQQPLFFGDVVDIWTCAGDPTHFNSRRCSEAAFHLISAQRYDDAAREVCDIDAICARLICGHSADLLHYLETLCHADTKFASNQWINVTKDYLIWIKRDISTLISSPADMIISSCSKLSASSCVKQDFLQKVWPQIRQHNESAAHEFDSKLWFPCICCNVLHENDGCISVFTHAHKVNVVVAHPSMPMFASGTDGCVVLVYDLNGSVESCFEGHEKGVSSLSWSHNGSLLASGSFDATIRIWDVESTTCLHVLRDHSDDIQSVQWSPVCQRNGTRILSGSVDKTIRVWDLIQDKAVCTILLDHESAVMSVCWSPDGLRFASSSWDGLVRVWDASSLLQIFELKGHSDAARCVSWSPDGRWLVSGSRDATIRIWSMETFTEAAVLMSTGSVNNAVFSVLWSLCGRWVFSATRHFAIQQWCTSTWTCLSTHNFHSESVFSLSAIHGALPFVLSSSGDCTVRLWNPESSVKSVDSIQNKIHSLSWNPFSQTLLCGSSDGSIRDFDSSLIEFKSIPFDAHQTFANVPISCIASSADGKRIAAGFDNDHICVYDLVVSSMKISSRLPRLNTSAVTISFSANGALIATGHPDNVIRIWDAQSVQTLLELSGHDAWVLSVSWTPSNLNPMRLLSGSADSSIRIWELWKDSAQASLNGRCYDKLTGSMGPISCLCWSPDGLRFASSSWDGLVRVWDASSLLQIFELKGHSDAARCVSWSPDGRWLVSGSRDATIRIWNVSQKLPLSSTGTAVLTLTGCALEVNHVAFSPCGKRIAACFSDFSVCIWYLTSITRSKHKKNESSSDCAAHHPSQAEVCRDDAFYEMLNVSKSNCIFAKYNDALFSVCHQCCLPILHESLLFVHFEASVLGKTSRLYHQSCLLRNKSLLKCTPIHLHYVHPDHRKEILEKFYSIEASPDLLAMHVSKERKRTTAVTESLWWALWTRLRSLPAHVVRDLLFWNDFIYNSFESRTTLCFIAANILVLGAPARCVNCGNKIQAAHLSWKCTSQFSNWSSCLAACCPHLIPTKHPSLPHSFQQHFPDFVFVAHHNRDSTADSCSSYQSWILDACHGSDADVDDALSFRAAEFMQQEHERYVSPTFATASHTSGVFRECSLDPSKHFVIAESGRALTATLVFVDAFNNENRFLKLQVVVLGIPPLDDHCAVLMPIQSDFKCHLVCVSGSIGHIAHSGVDLEEFQNVDGAVSKFYALYVEKTGNPWKDSQRRDKIGCKYFHVDLVELSASDAGPNMMQGEMPTESEHGCAFSISESILFYSKYTIVLPKAVTVVSDLFPLGPLSIQALNHAQRVLRELESCISELRGKVKLQKLLELSNQYFSLFPRRFHSSSVPLLSSEILISSESRCIQQFMDSTSLLSPKNVIPCPHRCNVFSNFETEFIDPAGAMFASIAQCIRQSHGASHSGWFMQVVDVLQVHHPLINRRFEKWLPVSNHQLLWHGTRKTNVGGILQHGLKISPAEAPCAG
jgi:WD40 repeat protein/ankyrin repeat protein